MGVPKLEFDKVWVAASDVELHNLVADMIMAAFVIGEFDWEVVENVAHIEPRK